MYICICCGIPADPQLPQLGTLGSSCVAKWLRRCRRFIQLATGNRLQLATATCHCHLLANKQLPGQANWPHPLANASALGWTLASVQLTPIDNGSFNSSFNGLFNVANWSMRPLCLSLSLYVSLSNGALLIDFVVGLWSTSDQAVRCAQIMNASHLTVTACATAMKSLIENWTRNIANKQQETLDKMYEDIQNLLTSVENGRLQTTANRGKFEINNQINK